jgi:hypothetical protein
MLIEPSGSSGGLISHVRDARRVLADSVPRRLDPSRPLVSISSVPLTHPSTPSVLAFWIFVPSRRTETMETMETLETVETMETLTDSGSVTPRSSCSVRHPAKTPLYLSSSVPEMCS